MNIPGAALCTEKCRGAITQPELNKTGSKPSDDNAADVVLIRARTHLQATREDNL
jgi:hypothetical protein